MKPLDLLKYYKQTDLDLVADQVLEIVEPYGKDGTLVGEIISTAFDIKASSPATTYKKLHLLEVKGLIQSRQDKKDLRCRKISITNKGMERLRAWAK